MGNYWCRLKSLETFSFFVIDGGVRRVFDSCGAWIERHKVQELVEQADLEVMRLSEQRAELLEALKEAVECGMVPTSSAREGGASAYSKQVQCADKIRDAIKNAERDE